MATEREPLLTRVEAAEFLNVRPSTLAVWNCTGRHGVPVIKIGRTVRYRRSDLEQWLAARQENVVDAEPATAR